MQTKILTPRQSLNKAYLKEKVLRSEIELFYNNLCKLFENIDHEEREENAKTILRDFLNNTYYQNKHFINTLRDIDLVIYLENNQDKAAVLAEVKRPKNKLEMITKDNLNAKAMHELIRYFLEERIDYKNNDIKYLIATNIYEWFIFDASVFENLFFKNKSLVKNYETWRDKQKTSGNTDLFYNEIAKPLLDEIKSEITFTYFNLNGFLSAKNSKTDPGADFDKNFIALYKILSPVHLLKQPFANDSNSLDRNFYNELLHIIGLVETKEKNKKLINRKPVKERDPGSVLENAILILETENTLSMIENPAKYGNSRDERLYNLALELSITWINRILFLKLLEAQLYNYHKDDKYKFLNKSIVKDFDELYKLFHQVLAVPTAERTELINKKFEHVPYLNSSLFEISDLENRTIKVNSLDDNTPLELYKHSVLKDKSGKKLNGKLPALHYLFDFLNAYDFTSEGKEEIQDDKKTLINASVLGLIFEKINGYKDGSYFTPGFITMYMAHETLTRAVIQKFNGIYAWKCESLNDLKNHLAQKRNAKDILEFNSVINSLRICDPAVGSGHFLVSALNELIAIKSELGILADSEGTVLIGYDAKVENDELIITFNNNEDIFEYHPPKNSGLSSRPKGRDLSATKVQRVQESLFNEKQTIIENCLFGVDINPNSVKIARLRLWIELLKNAYYTKESGYTQLETLPNIDINIKEGNSLISRFPLDADLKPALKTIKYNIDDYKKFVKGYKNTNDKNEKNNFRNFIEDIKNNFSIEINNNDPRRKKLNNLAYELHTKFQTERLIDIELNSKDKEKLKKQEAKLEHEITKIRKELDDEKNNLIYNNAFEWRFEFPEVLDDEGNFIGFDVVIGNPPYMILTKNIINNSLLQNYINNYISIKHSYSKNLFTLFIEKAIKINNVKNGLISMIVPEGLFGTRSYKDCSEYINNHGTIEQIVEFRDYVFEEAVTGNIVFLFNRMNNFTTTAYYEFDNNYILKQIEDKDDLIINAINQTITKHLKDICYLFKGMVVQDREKELSEKKKRELKDTFLLGNCIDKWSIKKEYYTNYDNLIIVGGTKVKSKHDKVPRILIRRTGDHLCCVLLEKKALTESTLYSCWSNSKDYDTRFILGVLNSKLLSYYIRQKMVTNKQAFPQILMTDLEMIPIVETPKNEQTLVVVIVDKILSLKKKDPLADTTKYEAEIDRLVYQLYGLTEEEIKIVEGTG